MDAVIEFCVMQAKVTHLPLEHTDGMDGRELNARCEGGTLGGRTGKPSAIDHARADERGSQATR